jgi:molecular chaperone GrpE
MQDNQEQQMKESTIVDKDEIKERSQNLENENSETEDLKNKITELEKKLSEADGKILRALADLDNQIKRSREELEKAHKFAITNFVGDLVTVVENFFMASDNAPKQEIEQNPAIKNYSLAIEMTQKELLKILDKNNVKRIYPLNQDFDHNFHEAVAQIDSDAKEGSVVQVIQAGYSIANRLIRPALVGVAKVKDNKDVS